MAGNQDIAALPPELLEQFRLRVQEAWDAASEWRFRYHGLKNRNAAFEVIMAELLTMRRVAKEEKNYQLADQLRAVLRRAGIEVRDTADGDDWQFSGTPPL